MQRTSALARRLSTQMLAVRGTVLGTPRMCTQPRASPSQSFSWTSPRSTVRSSLPLSCAPVSFSNSNSSGVWTRSSPRACFYSSSALESVSHSSYSSSHSSSPSSWFLLCSALLTVLGSVLVYTHETGTQARPLLRRVHASQQQEERAAAEQETDDMSTEETNEMATAFCETSPDRRHLLVVIGMCALFMVHVFRVVNPSSLLLLRSVCVPME
jgi:hypothetical protein